MAGFLKAHISPLEAAAGFIPLLQMGLYVWYRHHAAVDPEDGGLLAAAGETLLHKRRNLRPAAGMDDLLRGVRPCTAAAEILPGTHHTAPPHQGDDGGGIQRRRRRLPPLGRNFSSTSWSETSSATTTRHTARKSAVRIEVALRDYLKLSVISYPPPPPSMPINK